MLVSQCDGLTQLHDKKLQKVTDTYVDANISAIPSANSLKFCNLSLVSAFEN